MCEGKSRGKITSERITTGEAAENFKTLCRKTHAQRMKLMALHRSSSRGCPAGRETQVHFLCLTLSIMPQLMAWAQLSTTSLSRDPCAWSKAALDTRKAQQCGDAGTNENGPGVKLHPAHAPQAPTLTQHPAPFSTSHSFLLFQLTSSPSHALPWAALSISMWHHSKACDSRVSSVRTDFHD